VQDEADDLIVHKYAQRIFLQLLHPYCPRYLPAGLLDIVQPKEKILQAAAAKAQNAAAAAESDDEDDDEMEEEMKAEENETGGQPTTAVRLGGSKKDPLLRRKELLEGGLGRALARSCTKHASELFSTAHGADMLAELCGGGRDGVLGRVLEAKEMDEMHAGVVNVIKESMDSEDGDPAGLLGSYFGSRALRRIALASSLANSNQGEGSAASGQEIAARFVEALWREVMQGRCASLRDTHAAKVIAACVHGGSALATKGIRAELKQAKVDVDLWCEKFVHRN
jgi:hypothetical protein